MENLFESLEYVKKYKNEIFVVKFGGSTLGDEKSIENVGRNLKYLHDVGIKIVLVHGAGILISKLMKDLSLNVEFFQGERITDSKSLYVVIGALQYINKKIVDKFINFGINAIGISGIIFARKKENLGFVGDVKNINIDVIKNLLDNNYIPVISPIGIDKHHTEILNINADYVATEIFSLLKARKFIVLTSVKGVLNENGELISKLTVEECKNLIEKGVITNGMIPKVKSCIEAIEKRKECEAHIVSAYGDSLLKEIFTEKGSGTLIVK
ncbi:MAG: acetylglutamate kinase [Candidatus Altarchaeaceae archaeon]